MDSSNIKKIFFLFIFFSFFFIFNKCYAYTVTYDNTTYTIPDGITKFLIVESYPGHEKTLLYTENNGDFKVYGFATLYFTVIAKDNGNFYVKKGTTTTTDFSSITPEQRTANYAVYNTPAYGSCNIYFQNGTDIMFTGTPVVTYTQPRFITTSNEFSNFENLENIEIDQGSFEDSIYLKLYDSTNNNLLFSRKLTDYNQYIEREDLDNPFSNLIYRIPISSLPTFNLVSNNNYEFRLVYYNENDVLSIVSSFFTVSTGQAVNDSSNTEINNNLENINDSINETNEKLDNLNENITSDDISGVNASDLPSVTVNDPTESGIGTIFQNLYNAFCVGNAQDVVFPIPFTNKSITLSPTYMYDMLHNSNADWLITFIQAFWAYLIGRFIIKDMASKIMKIKSGNIENLQNENIKTEML